MNNCPSHAWGDVSELGQLVSPRYLRSRRQHQPPIGSSALTRAVSSQAGRDGSFDTCGVACREATEGCVLPNPWRTLASCPANSEQLFKVTKRHLAELVSPLCRQVLEEGRELVLFTFLARGCGIVNPLQRGRALGCSLPRGGLFFLIAF